MACSYNNAGFASLNPGQSFTVTITHGQDCGAQFNSANPLNPGGTLTAQDQAKGLDDEGNVFYTALISNVGSNATNMTFQGGGLS